MYKFVALFVFSVFLQDASAYIMHGNSRIDHALYDGHDQKLIVYGIITKKHNREPRDSTQIYFFDGPETREIDFQINHVIMGNDSLKSKTIRLRTGSFDWPLDLSPREENVPFILILSMYGDEEFPYYITTVVPSVSLKFQTVNNNSDAKKLLSEELVLVVNQSKKESQVREAMLQLAPILLEKNSPDVLSFLDSKNEWIRRATIAGLVYATESNESIKLAALDIQEFISKTHQDSLITEIDHGHHSAPYSLYQDFMFFIDSYCWNDDGAWSTEEREKDCRIVQKIIATGILDKKVIHILEKNF